MEIDREELLLRLNLREIRRPAESELQPVVDDVEDQGAWSNSSRVESSECLVVVAPAESAASHDEVDDDDDDDDPILDSVEVGPMKSLVIAHPASPSSRACEDVCEDVCFYDTVSDHRMDDSDIFEQDAGESSAVAVGKRFKVRRTAQGYEQSIASWAATMLSLEHTPEVSSVRADVGLSSSSAGILFISQRHALTLA